MSECKGKDRELIAWYRRRLAESGVSVHMNSDITELGELDADEIVIATGGTAKRLRRRAEQIIRRHTRKFTAKTPRAHKSAAFLPLTAYRAVGIISV